MPRKLLSHPYEKGASETWAWRTDVLTSVTGDEQRVAILEYPDETLALTIGYGDDGQQIFDGEPEISGQEAIVRSLDDLIACRGEVEIPLWHLSDRLASASWTTGTQIANLALPSATDTPFFVAIGEDVLVETGTIWRRAEVTAYSQAAGTLTVDFGANTGAAAADLTQLAPLRTGLIPDLSAIQFARAAHVAEASFKVLLDRTQGRSSLTGGLTLSTDTPNSWPVIEPRGIANGLELRVDHGLQTITSPSGFPYYVTHWTEAKLKGSTADTFRRYQGNRFRYWRTFLATLRGSQGGFWFPTRRGEYRVLSADEGLETVTVEGRAFFDLWSETNLKAVCLDSTEGDLAVRQVTSCELSGDDSVLGISGGWGFADPVLQLSLALPCRIDGDSVTWTYDTGASIEFGVVSVPYEYPVVDDPIDWGGLLAQIDASSAFAEFDGEARYDTVPIVGELGGEVTRIHSDAGPEQAPVNYLRAMSFEDVPFDPTLGGTLDVWLWADTLLTQFRFGTVPADLQFEGEGEVPRVYILPGGDPTPSKLLGEARYVKTWEDGGDPATPLGPSRATAPERAEDGYRLRFADTSYFAPYWTPPAVGMNDRSGSENHLTTSIDAGAYRDSASERYRVSSGLENYDLTTVPTTGPKLFAMVGLYESDPGLPEDGLISLGGAGPDYAIYLNDDGEFVLNRDLENSPEGPPVGSLTVGDWFLLLAVFDGAASSIHVIKNDETTWASGTVDDGATTHSAIDSMFSGWAKINAYLISEVPDDIPSYREGLARHYGFQSLVSQTGMSAETSDADGWAVLHDGTTDYVLSVVLDIQEPGPATITLFEALNDAENGGMRWEWTKATDELTVTFIGTAGTFAETFDLSTPLLDSPRPVIELVFDESDPSATLYVNGASQGSFFPSGFTFSTVQQNSLRFGEDRGWVFCELQLREGSTLQYESLSWKWQAYGALLFDGDEEFLVSTDDSSLIVGW
jgi:hypothetical protein